MNLHFLTKRIDPVYYPAILHFGMSLWMVISGCYLLSGIPPHYPLIMMSLFMCAGMILEYINYRKSEPRYIEKGLLLRIGSVEQTPDGYHLSDWHVYGAHTGFWFPADQTTTQGFSMKFGGYSLDELREIARRHQEDPNFHSEHMSEWLARNR